LAARAHGCGRLAGEQLGDLLTVEAQAYSFTLDRDSQAQKSREALALLRPGCANYMMAAHTLIAAESARGNHAVVEEWVEPYIHLVPESSALNEYVLLGGVLLYGVVSQAKFDLARRLFSHLEAWMVYGPDSWHRMQLGVSRSMYLRSVEPDP